MSQVKDQSDSNMVELRTSVLGTFPRFATFLLALSLAIRILCLEGIL